MIPFFATSTKKGGAAQIFATWQIGRKSMLFQNAITVGKPFIIPGCLIAGQPQNNKWLPYHDGGPDAKI
ncbi:MAG: hypothetical protein H0V70_21455 [Ktedonobacteraceae bacterium]|nr:hypothetical protein [Ktedonobacteraceae bacterium]